MLWDFVFLNSINRRSFFDSLSEISISIMKMIKKQTLMFWFLNKKVNHTKIDTK